jgi:hypothetical protein
MKNKIKKMVNEYNMLGIAYMHFGKQKRIVTTDAHGFTRIKDLLTTEDTEFTVSNVFIDFSSVLSAISVV